MNNNWLSRQAARFAAVLLVVGIGCSLASCGEGGDSTPGLQSIEVTPPNAQAAAGTSLQLAATGIYSDGTHQDVTSQVIWGTSNAAIASFAPGSGGTVSAATTGAVTIAATLHDRVGTTNFTVTPAVLVSIQVTPASPSVASGYLYGLVATGIFSDGTSQDMTRQVTWASSDTAVATISNATGSFGVASTAEVGMTTITATTTGGISGSTTLTVTPAVLMFIFITPFNANLPQGVSRQFTANGLFSDNTTQDVTTQVTWASSAPTDAAVSNATGSAGLVVATALGTSIISATTASGVTATSPVTVTAAILASIQVTPNNATVANGLTEQFTATGTYTDGSTQNLTSQVTWASSNSAAATVSNASGSNGLASTAGVGTTTVSASLLGILVSSATLNVSAAQLVSIQVTPGSPGIGNGLTEQFIATGTYSDNSQQFLTSQVTWASSNTGAATISNAAGSNGLATSAGIGTTTISAISGGTVSGSTVLTVSQPPHLYIADGVNVYICSLNLTDGTFTGCAATGSGFQDPVGIVFTGGLAYVSNVAVQTGPSVSVCNVATDGTLTGCALTAASPSIPTLLAAVGTTLYAVDNGVPGVTYCTILPDGTLSNCGLTATDFNSFGIAVSPAGNIYLSNNSSKVDMCTVGMSGAFSSCIDTGIVDVPTNSIAFAGNLAYLANTNPAVPPEVDVCPIDVDGTFGTCAASLLPVGSSPLAVSVVGSHAYVSDEVTGVIYLCNVSPVDGSLANCAGSSGGVSLYRPTQIAAY